MVNHPKPEHDGKQVVFIHRDLDLILNYVFMKRTMHVVACTIRLN